MAVKAGFGEVDITPTTPADVIGWARQVTAEELNDPLYARVAIFDDSSERIAFVQLDVLGAPDELTAEIRQAIEEAHAFAGSRVMVTTTHSHGSPAVFGARYCSRDDAYVQMMLEAIVSAFGDALSRMQPAKIGQASTFEFDVSENRRVRMRDGTTKTNGTFDDPNALCFEGPIDPEVAVLAAQSTDGDLLGCMVNFACHPTHMGSGGCFSANFPGVFADVMKSRGCPVPMFLQGACGNIRARRIVHPEDPITMEQAGTRLADDAMEVLEGLNCTEEVSLHVAARTIELPFREVTEAQKTGTATGAQRFGDADLYDKTMPKLIERIEQQGTARAEIQAFFVGDRAYIAIPGEYFCQHGMRVKEETFPTHTVVVGYANGHLGYIPHKEAFERGGYETTFGTSSKLAPEAGDMLADCAIELIRGS